MSSTLSLQHTWSTRWHPQTSRSFSQVPRLWRDWLLDKGSLTGRLVKLSAGDFGVQIIYEGWSQPQLQEHMVLGCARGERVWVREVFLLGHGEPWVYARSVIPARTLTGKRRHLKRLGNRPLGAVLFNDPSMQRGPIETARVVLASSDPQWPERQVTWGRRSVFYLQQKPLLVTEVFLPALLSV